MFNRMITFIVIGVTLSFLTVTAHAETPKEPLWPILKEIHFEGKVIFSLRLKKDSDINQLMS